MSDLVERLRQTLGGIAQEECGGDNLAILLASYFEPGIESDELDDSGTWKQGAIDACDKVLEAIHEHYAAALTAKDKEIEALRAEIVILRDMLLNPDPAIEPDNLRLHREKCGALDRAFAAEARAETAERRVTELEVNRDALAAWSKREEDRAESAERERDELQQVFDFTWKADQRAIKAWQAAHPDRPTTWPDHADMVVWLLGVLDEARAAINTIDKIVHTPTPGNEKAQRHFQRDFDAIRKIAVPFRAARAVIEQGE